jgi:AcrR family transcriptional regulator
MPAHVEYNTAVKSATLHPKVDRSSPQKRRAATKRQASEGGTERAPPSTADRILEASLKLFNEFGFRSVPAMKIAMHLGISQGNLAYHFKSKNDIVAAVFPKLEKEVREAKKPGGPFLPSDAVDHQINVLRILWRYRFFFNALTQLLPDEPELSERFNSLQATVIGALRDLMDELITQGYMREVAPNSTLLMARAIWMLLLSWLRFEQIANPRNEEPGNDALYDAVALNSTIVGPYFSPQFVAMMETHLRKILPDVTRRKSGAGSGLTGDPATAGKRKAAAKRRRPAGH